MPYRKTKESGHRPPKGTQINWGHPLAKSLTGLWLFNDASSGVVADLVSGLPGTYNATPLFAGTKIGLGFNAGGNNYVNAGLPGPRLISTGSATLMVWLKSTNISTGFGFLGQATGGISRLIAIEGGSTNNNVRMECYDGANNPFVDGTIIINDGNLHQIIGVRNKGVGLLQLYVDGKFDASAGDSSGNLSGGTINWNIGRRPDTGNTFNGTIAMAATWGRALKYSEIRQLYAFPFSLLQPPKRRIISHQPTISPVFINKQFLQIMGVGT